MAQEWKETEIKREGWEKILEKQQKAEKEESGS